MKSLRLLLIVAAAWVSVWSTAAQAVPAFARQTAKPCSACHFQHFPTLNAFGREFKASGYTLKSMIPEHDDYIEADNLSLPAVLNASLVTKLRYRKTNGDAKDELTNAGEINLPDEAALFLGGRAGEHIGFIAEVGLNVKTSNFLNFKTVLTDKVDDTRISLIPFTSDGGGASFGFELLNTGAVNMTHPLENKRAIIPQRFIHGSEEVGGSPATGIALVASSSKWFVNYTLWHPAWLGEGGAAAGHKKFANYIRAAVTPTIGEWDTGFGVQLYSGSSETIDATSTATTEVIAKAETKASFIDAQAQGSVGGMPLGVYFAYGKAPKSGDAANLNLYNSSLTNDQKAWSLLGELGVMPRLSVFLGYLDGDTGAAANSKAKSTTIGLNWMVAQNSNLQFWNTKKSGSAYDPAPADGTSMTGIMLFSGF